MKTSQKQKIKNKMIHIFILLIILLFNNTLFAQQNLRDVVYLKNGSIIHGIIIEQVPGKTIKIQTTDQNVFVFKMDEIKKLAKEPVPDTQTQYKSRKKTREAASQDLKRFSVLVNPLGFLQFGPYIQGEVRFLPNMVFCPHFRFAGCGLLTHAVAAYDDVWISSGAVGFGVKHFFEQPNLSNRMYLGAYYEAGWTRGEDEIYYHENWITDDHHCLYHTFTVNLGYRWRYNKFYINAGGLCGIAIEDWDGNYEQGAVYPNDTYFIGMLELSIGKEF